MDKEEIKYLSLIEIRELQDLLMNELVNREIRKDNIDLYAEVTNNQLETYREKWRSQLIDMIRIDNKVCEEVCKEHIRIISTELLCRKIYETAHIKKGE
jgi:hypothetical protein